MHKSRWVKLMLGALMIGALVFAAACSGGDGADGESLTIGFSQRRIAGSDWWKTLVDGAKYAAEQEGVTLELLDANGDTVQQNSDIQTLVTKGVDAIIVNPNDPLGLKQAIDAAMAEGIPVIAVNCALDESIEKTIYGYVVEDQIATGARGGYLLAPLVAERNPDLVGKKAKAIIIGGYPGDVLSDLRAQGYMEGYQKWLDENPGKGVELEYLEMKYGEWLPEPALKVMRDVATANPDLVVVMSESCVMNSGIVQGLKAAGIYDQITMATYDGYMTSVKEMMDFPDGVLQVCTTNEPYRQGLAAVEMAIRAAKGGEPEGTVYIETVAFDTSTAADFYDAKKILVDTVQ
jgi:ribose transport system substrate-binding protein